MPIQFFTEDTSFKLESEKPAKVWLSKVVESHNFQLGELNFIFCSDEYLLSLNEEYLNHDTLTDIITFDNSEDNSVIEGDIFISIDRVKENASLFNVTFYKELHRVLAHGLLHLLGFNDKTMEQQEEMRKKEEACLSLLPN